MTASIFYHSYFGWKLQAPFAIECLPRCEEARGEDGLGSSLVLREGVVPRILPDPVWSSPFITVGQSGSVLVTIEESGRFLVPSDGDIVFERAEGVPDRDIAALFTSVAAGVVLHRRGVLPLHAGCVELQGRAFAITGRTGQGKSTLSRVLVNEGLRLYSDDITAVRFTSGGVPMVSPGTLASRLWLDAVRAVGEEEILWPPVRNGVHKRIRPTAAYAAGEAPLAAIIRLETAANGPARILRLPGPTGLLPLSSTIYRFNLAKIIGDQARLFHAAMCLAGAVPIFQLEHSRHIEEIGILGELVLEFLQRERWRDK